MKVYKFGGASVKSADGVKTLLEIINSEKSKLVVVVSAMGKTTNMLEEVVNSYFNRKPDLAQNVQIVKEFHKNLVNELFCHCGLDQAPPPPPPQKGGEQVLPIESVGCTSQNLPPEGGLRGAYRLIHGEGDNLPALVVDIYGSTAILQAHSVGFHNVRQILAEILVEEIPEVENVYYKSEQTLPFKAQIEPQDEYLIGSKSDCIAVENGLKIYVDWLKGQKTGFFIDQRENRSLLEHYAKNRDVLNMFCYTGGFSLYAMRGGANSVHSVDSSAKAISLTDKNIALNFNDDLRHKSFAEDAFKFLENIREKYDLIVLDPPAFAKHRDALKNALQGYKRLNFRAIEQIRSGGILFTFSCSQAVTKEQFRLAVFSAAAQAKRNVKILHQLTQSADHPINIYHPEGEYLKGLVLYVE